jgi:DNA-binding CsgD family transcriptional regulator
VLVDRDVERAALGDVLEHAVRGCARAVLLVGEPGTGKTALLTATAEAAAARGFRVVVADAVESERGIPGAAVSLIVSGLADIVAGLTPESGYVLRSALRGAAGDRLPGHLLELLARTAEAAPLLVVADDVQWWDRESLLALTFAARRLAADDVAVLVAGRPAALDRPAVAALERLTVRGLDEESGVALLRSVTADVVPEVALELVRTLDGNPQAIIETPELLDPRARVGAAPLPVPLPVRAEVSRRWAQTLPHLPEPTRRALAVLAVDDTGSVVVVEQAWTTLGCGPDDLLPAEAVHLVGLGPRGWEFPHSLVRSAVCAALTPPERREAHAALATVLAGTGRDAHYAAHLAAASIGPDSDVADELARVADSLVRVNAVAAAAAAADQSARVTPPGPDLPRRLLEAATLALRALDENRAEELAEQGLLLEPGPATAAELQRVVGLVVGHRRDTRRGVALLRQSAAVPGSRDRVGTLVDALAFVKMWNDPPASLGLVAEMGDLTALEPWMCLDVGNALAAAGRWIDSVPLLHRGLREVDPTAPGVRETVVDAWSDGAAILGLEHLTERYRDVARVLRDSGSAVRAEAGLTMEVELAHSEGRWSEAEAVNEECRELSAALGRVPLFSYGTDLRLSARRGDRARFEATEADLRAAAAAAGLVLVLANADGLRATLMVSLGDDEAAEHALRRTVEAAPTGMLVTTIFPSAAVSLVELLVREGRRSEALDVAAAVVGRLQVQPSRMARSYAERILGVVAPDDEAEEHLRAAVELSERGMHAFEAARAQLALGRWLRRRRRRADSVGQLLPALGAFVSMGCDPWAARCREELHAAGVDALRVDPHDGAATLTAQERQVAEAAAAGLTNAAIARRMYLSPKTIELHLTHVYRKLGITGRAGLVDALPVHSVVGRPGTLSAGC